MAATASTDSVADLDLPDVDDRNIEADLSSPWAGQRGVPVDARCVGCGTRKAILSPERDPEDDSTSLQKPCKNCQGATWWNVTEVLDSRRVER